MSEHTSQLEFVHVTHLFPWELTCKSPEHSAQLSLLLQETHESILQERQTLLSFVYWSAQFSQTFAYWQRSQLEILQAIQVLLNKVVNSGQAQVPFLTSKVLSQVLQKFVSEQVVQ